MTETEHWCYRYISGLCTRCRSQLFYACMYICTYVYISKKEGTIQKTILVGCMGVTYAGKNCSTLFPFNKRSGFCFDILAFQPRLQLCCDIWNTSYRNGRSFNVIEVTFPAPPNMVRELFNLLTSLVFS